MHVTEVWNKNSNFSDYIKVYKHWENTQNRYISSVANVDFIRENLYKQKPI